MEKIGKTANFYLAVFISGIFAIGTIFAISSTNSTEKLEIGKPETSIQEYLQALNDGRNEVAASYFSSTSRCKVEDIDRAYIDSNLQVILDKVVIEGDQSAIVYISIERNDSPLRADPYVEKRNYRMVKESGKWKISGIPWPLYDCGVLFK